MSVPLPAYRPLPSEFEPLVRARRSIRHFTAEAVSLDQVGYLLIAAQGVTGDSPHRRAIPSPGGLHTLTLYVAATRVTGLPAGVWRYDALTGSLDPLGVGNPWPEITAGASGLRRVNEAPAALFISTTAGPATAKYGDRARRYVLMEAGHCGQNICLAAGALGLGAVTVGQFDDGALAGVFHLGPEEDPLYLLPFGHPAPVQPASPASTA